MMLPTVKIQTNDKGFTNVYVNDRKIDRVVSVRFVQDVENIPCTYLEVTGFPDIEVGGAVILDVHPDNLISASKVVVGAYKGDIEFKKATISCIKGAIKDSANLSLDEKAEFIADRIYGFN